MAQVVAFVPDLLFGSNVIGALRGAGHEARLVSEIGESDLVDADLVVVDLTTEAGSRIERLASLGQRPPVLAFYAHVEADVRAQAEAAGFELVVPRSRMAREGSALVEKLIG